MNVRDLLRRYLPSWLADNGPEAPSWGFRFVWACALLADLGIEAMLQGSLGAVARGSPTALRYVGAARGILRGHGESQESYAERLRGWIDVWKSAGTAYCLAKEIHGYLATRPRVRVVTRWGFWVTVDTDGTITTTQAPWDWDSVSHPERNDPDKPYWSDLWIIVYSPWPERAGTLGELSGDDGFALGHYATHGEVNDMRQILAEKKAAHECIRAVIWTTDPDLFDPEAPETCPNGRWGAWGIYDGSSYVKSDRNLVSCRYWEPRFSRLRADEVTDG